MNEPPVSESITRRVWTLALPTVAYNFLEMTLGLVDLLMVRPFGPEATAAIGLIRQFTFIVEAAVASIVVGVVALVSQGLGKRDQQQIDDTVQQSLYAAALLGLGLTVAGFFSAEAIMWILQMSPESAAHGEPYTRVYFLGVVFLCVNAVSAGILRGAKDATTPLKLAMLMAVVNIPLNYLFIHPMGFGVMGAAMGTTVARFVGTAAFLFILVRGIAGVRFRTVIPRLHINHIRRILRIGLPITFAGLLRNTARIAYITVVGLSALGVALQAAVGVGLQFRLFAVLPALGFQIAIATLVGEAIGKGDYEEAEAIGRRAVAMLMGIMAVVCAAVIVAAYPIAVLFINDSETARLGATVLRWFAVGQFFSCSAIGIQGILSGAGDTRPVMRYTLMSQWGVLFGLGLVLLEVFELDPEGILLSWTVAPMFMLVWLWRRFRAGYWKTVSV